MTVPTEIGTNLLLNKKKFISQLYLLSIRTNKNAKVIKNSVQDKRRAKITEKPVNS